MKSLRSPRAVVAQVVVLYSALCVGVAQAQAVAPTTAASPPPAPASPLLGLMQGLVGLVIVIGVIYIAAWAMRKIGPRARSGGVVQVVGGASVGPREKVVVVRFGGRTLLLGVAAGQVSLLHTAEPGDFADEGIAGSPATTPRFIDRLRAARSDT